jgi:hypothetical protein
VIRAVAVSDAVQITVAVAAFFLILAALTLLRLVLRKTEGTRWRRIRVGVFMERDDEKEE